MNDNLMFDYLLEMGAMKPEQEDLLRKQKMVDALRDQASQGPEGKMVSGHYVAPSITQYAAQMANAYGARKGQEGIKGELGDLNRKQRLAIELLRRRQNPLAGSSSLNAIDIGPQDYSWMQSAPQQF